MKSIYDKEKHSKPLGPRANTITWSAKSFSGGPESGFLTTWGRSPAFIPEIPSPKPPPAWKIDFRRDVDHDSGRLVISGRLELMSGNDVPNHILNLRIDLDRTLCNLDPQFPTSTEEKMRHELIVEKDKYLKENPDF